MLGSISGAGEEEEEGERACVCVAFSGLSHSGNKHVRSNTQVIKLPPHDSSRHVYATMRVALAAHGIFRACTTVCKFSVFRYIPSAVQPNLYHLPFPSPPAWKQCVKQRRTDSSATPHVPANLFQLSPIAKPLTKTQGFGISIIGSSSYNNDRL